MLKPGTAIDGKWTNSHFTIEKKLGSGANGEVFLVRSAKGLAAMKVCPRSADIALEWGLLDGPLKGNRILPKPILVDDAKAFKDQYFYLMEWIPGLPLSEVLPTLKESGFVQVVHLLLTGLSELHGMGYAFCDMKPQNILVAVTPNVSVRFVDVGGVTPFGRSVRQFTPFYDRAFWNVGSRRAEASYDLCGLALALVLTFTPPSPQIAQLPPERRQAWLEKAVQSFPHPHYRTLAREVLEGKLTDVQDCLGRLAVLEKSGTQPRQSLWKGTSSKASKASKPTGQANPKAGAKTGFKGQRAVGSRRAKATDWTEWVMWLSLGTAATVTLAAWGTFLGWF
ncbi:hypothetical protein LLE49_26380 [Alicyclobacillus tolerans]|uniref:protein kinase domain-containing protein n=1 Tax=Alicyclobacillus tolerans TaxID=90970 RepID=UPI001F399920|nr:hypothetical protein [Alicyclobacillus tolerans]MCF8568254.1 hypothetical protein [Alicyclobacillus tolerans]